MLAATQKLVETIEQIQLTDAKDDWDVSPVLALLGQKDGQDDVAFILLAGGGETYEKLHYLAASEELKTFTEGRRVDAVVLQTEAFALKATVKETLLGDYQAAREMGLQLSDHPNSVEVKMISILDADGFETLTLERGGDKFEAVGGSGEGRIPDALRHLIEAANA